MLRLAMVDAGLPEPELQLTLRSGDQSSPSADLGYRARRIAIQYDGGHHLTEAQIFSDKRRDKAFEAAGWTVLTVRKDDLADGFQDVIARIKRAVRRAQLDHPEAAGFADAR
jgi:very-short-patch-repair endonuclease